MIFIERKTDDIYVRTAAGYRFVRQFRDSGLPHWIPLDFWGRADIVPLEVEYYHMREDLGGDKSGLPLSALTLDEIKQWTEE